MGMAVFWLLMPVAEVRKHLFILGHAVLSYAGPGRFVVLGRPVGQTVQVVPVVMGTGAAFCLDSRVSAGITTF